MIRYAHTNMLLADDGRWTAVYRVPCVSYPFLPERLKREQFERWRSFAATIGRDFALHRVARTTPGSDSQIAEVYIVVELQHRRLLFDRAATALTTRLGRRVLPRRLLDELGVVEEEIAELVASSVHGRRARTSEIRWLLARTPLRGCREPVNDPFWTSQAVHLDRDDEGCFEPLSAATSDLVACRLLEERSFVRVEHDSGISHQAVLLVGTLPSDCRFPDGCELWFRPLELPGVHVDALLTCAWVANAQALRDARRLVLDADNAQDEHDLASRRPDSRIEERQASARALKQYLEIDAAPPMLKARLTLLVSAPSHGELERSIRALKAMVAPVSVSASAFKQQRLWREHTVGVVEPARVVQQLLTTEQLASLMPTATEQTGTSAGPRVGHVVSSHRPVLLDLSQVARGDRPPSALLVGTLGSGKTMTAQLLAVQAAQAGATVVSVDPKHDHALDRVPELAGRVEVIDLGDITTNRGVLDPMRIEDPDLREEVTCDFLLQLLGSRDVGLSTAIRRAIRAAADAEHPRTIDVVDQLAQDEDHAAIRAGEQLGVIAQSGLASLAFATGQEAAPTGGMQVTSIRCRGLTLPEPDVLRGEYSDAERVSMAILTLISSYAMRLARSRRGLAKLVFVDEAWVLLRSSTGRALIDGLNRMGRSENAALVLATQQLDDAGRVRDLIGTHVAFGQETSEQATSVAALLGLDVSPQLVDLITAMRSGMCLIRDSRGRVAQVQITPPQHLLDVLATTPTQDAA